MEHHNKKPILPAFQASGFPAQFPALQNNSANALMSTLQTLQMHSLGNSIIPTSNITPADISHRLLLEQVKAMHSVYSTLQMKPAEASAATNGVGSNSGNVFERNGVTTKLAANTIFPTQFLANDFQNMATAQMVDHVKSIQEETPASSSSSHPSSSTPGEIDVGTNLSAPLDVQTNALAGLFQNSVNFNRNFQQAVSEMMLQQAKIGERFLESNLAKPATTETSNSATSTDMSSNIQTDVLKQTPRKESGIRHNEETGIMTNSTEEQSTSAASKDAPKENHVDDVEDMFGLSTLDDGEEETTTDNGIFGLSVGGEYGGLSPVQFTPPDSPTANSSTDFLFGIDSSNRTKHVSFPCSSEPSTSNSAMTSTKTAKSADEFKSFTSPHISSNDDCSDYTTPQVQSSTKNNNTKERSTIKCNKVPIYKQKVLMALTKVKKEITDDSKYDAFEFEDEEEDVCIRAPEAEKSEVDVLASYDNKSKNVYVPGIGFAISNEPTSQESWKSSSPRKRLLSEKSFASGSTIPSNLLMNEAHTSKQNDSAIVTLAESIRIRRNQRMTNNFLQLAMSSDAECVKTKQIRLRSSKPLISKMIVRITRIFETNDTGPPKRKKKKKDDEDEDCENDSDWDQYSLVKRKQKCWKDVYELRTVDPTQEEEKFIDKKSDIDYIIPRRLNGSCAMTTRHSALRKEYFDEVQFRLSLFGSAEGFLPKGTYVVCKSDLFKDDCALWRVDNQTLLQKFPPRSDPVTKKQIYKSSSTYSGWCEQIAHQYLRVGVRVLKQSRTEIIIEPEIPLQDLLPAVSEESNKNLRSVCFSDSSKNVFDEAFLLKDPLKVALNTLICSFLDHALTTTHLQTMKEKDDWTFRRSILELDRVSMESAHQIRNNVIINDRIEYLICDYTRISIQDTDFYETMFCQICHRKRVKKIIQYFDRGEYDPDTLEFKLEVETFELELYLPSVDVYACVKCSNAVGYLHKIKHTKLMLLRSCEDKLESISTEYQEITPERIVEVVKKDKQWISGIVAEYCDMWKSIKSEYK